MHTVLLSFGFLSEPLLSNPGGMQSTFEAMLTRFAQPVDVFFFLGGYSLECWMNI